MSDEEIQINMTPRQAATMCLVCTSMVVMIYLGDMKDPLTGADVSMTSLIDLVEIIERTNMAIGNEPSIELRELVYEMRKKFG
jgi:hypothetical protein